MIAQERTDFDFIVTGAAGCLLANRLSSDPAARVALIEAGARYSEAELSPGPAVKSDAELEAFIRANVATTYHPVGTCKMGPQRDPMAVVDSRLRVHGITGLRVADASIMPNITGGNTSAPAMMIGERAAVFVMQDCRSDTANASPKLRSVAGAYA